ncbi:MAG: hypothetical protein RLZZ74_2003 [Cyanobacteriota bacterium]|jgi:hypothetical protein
MRLLVLVTHWQKRSQLPWVSRCCKVVVIVFMIALFMYIGVLFLERDGKREKVICFFIHIITLTNIKQNVKLCNKKKLINSRSMDRARKFPHRGVWDR